MRLIKFLGSGHGVKVHLRNPRRRDSNHFRTAHLRGSLNDIAGPPKLGQIGQGRSFDVFCAKIGGAVVDDGFEKGDDDVHDFGYMRVGSVKSFFLMWSIYRAAK